MGNGLFSSLPRKERFLAYVGTILLAVVMLVFVICLGIIIQERVQLSRDAIKQPSSTAAGALNNENGLNSSSIWDNTKGAGVAPNSTASLSTLLPAPTNSAANSK